METFALYLLQSVTWLSGFTLIFIIFLRNERFFLLNRIYLIAGILTSFIFPFISVHYSVVLPVTPTIQTDVTVLNGVPEIAAEKIPALKLLLMGLYLSGAITVIVILIKQSKHLIIAIKKAEIVKAHPVKLIRTAEYSSSFSFFSYVFVNPSITEIETEEIVNHELVHIRQGHWVDLLLVELLCMLQWFNPLVWIYIRFIRQNHEYLADEAALQRSSDPAIYRAALLNQIVGSPVVSLGNSFNYSLNKKRFNMMKNIISSPYRKMKVLFILPVFAIVLYAFATPDYKYISADDNPAGTIVIPDASIKEVKGSVVQQNGSPLTGATIMVRGTTTGSTTDANGNFRLDNVPDDGTLVVSYIGYKTKVINPVFTSDMIIRMDKDTMNLKSIQVPPPPPPPPPLYIIDGKISDMHYNSVSKENTESANVLKADEAVKKYGDKAKYGAVEITTKNKNAPSQVKVVEGYNLNAPPPPPPPLASTYIRLGSDFDAKPLILVNGVIRDIEVNSIDPNTIESVSVLKDQSATAVFGEKGKNGVILISLKPGTIFKDLSKPISVKGEDLVVVGYGKDTSKSERIRIRNSDGGSSTNALIVIDGKISEKGINDVSPSQIESLSVLKYGPVVERYGEKGKNGVIIITSKHSYTKLNTLPEVKINGDENKEDKFVVMEELPTFPGGEKAIQSYIYSKIRVKKGWEKISEPVYVVFTVDSKGKVQDAQVLKKKYPTWEAEAIRVVSSMPDWKPGSQNGKPIDAIMQLPIDFSIVGKK